MKSNDERWRCIEILSELRANYSCFEENEEPYYKALSVGIKAIRDQISDSHEGRKENNMADIALVIKIDEKTVNEIRDNVMFAGSISSDIRWDVTSAIKNGTPLPKGHKRLIEDEFITVTDIRKDGSEFTYVPYKDIEDAPTIIEADNAESEE